MSEKYVKNYSWENSDERIQDMIDEESARLLLKFLIAYEIQKHFENSLRNHDIISKLDKLLIDVGEELFKQREEIDVK
jgi:hypothetical protein